MNPRPLALLVTLLLATPAAAGPRPKPAPKPVCQLVTDPAGDARPDDNLPSRDGIDILSADIATGKTNLVGVVRLASVSLDPMLAGGLTVRFKWVANGAKQELVLFQFVDGTRTGKFDPDENGLMPAIDVKVVVDNATKSVVWTVPRKTVPQLAKKAAKFGQFDVRANPAVNYTAPGITGTADPGLSGDTATSGQTYTDLTLSCVKGV